MTVLSESLKVRMEAELREELLEEARRQERPEGNLVRRYIREGIARDRDNREHSRRVS